MDARREEYKINLPKLRSHSVPYEPNDDERNYLNSIYSGKCQICGKTIDLWDGEHYFEAINLLDISNSELRSTYGIGWNSLSLCPNCAVKYKYTGELPEDFSDKIREKPMLTEEEMEDGVDVSINLRGIPTDIHYVADHFKNLQTALKKYLEEEEEQR